MRFRFTLSHTGLKEETVSALPARSLWENIGSGESWVLTGDPTVSITGTGTSKLLATPFKPLFALPYTITYQIDMLENLGGSYTAKVGFIKDGVFVGTTTTIGTSTGTHSGTAQISTSQHADYIGFQLDGSGSFSVLTVEVATMANFQAFIQHSSELEISEPDGWEGAVLKLERHDDFKSLIEYFEGSANGAFIFYGENNDVNGGLNYIKEIERDYGVNAKIAMLIELDPNDDDNYETVFDGLLKLSTAVEIKNKLQVGVIRNDFWANFISRLDTPVDVMSSTDVYGNPVTVFQAINLNLPPQKLRKIFHGLQEESETVQYTITDNQYGQIDFLQVLKDEIEVKYTLPRLDNSQRPSELFAVDWAGYYALDIQVYTTTAIIGGSATDPNLHIKLQINEDSAITLTKTNETFGIDTLTKHTYSGGILLEKGDLIRLYFYNNNAVGASYTFAWPANVLYGSHLIINADTTYTETNAQAFLIHDLGYQIAERLGLGDSPFYSEVLGGTLTQTRTYAENGCGWMYAVLEGLQLRGYTLTEKPMSMSFKQWWDGINPILNLGLCYGNTNDSPASEVLEIGKAADQFNPDFIVTFSNVDGITRSYDTSKIYKTIRAGYKKWQAEESIDDPQTKQTRATVFETEGSDITIESDFIAGSLAIEACRRSQLEKSKDYKHDNETFIIALNEDDVSPDRYEPEINENFNSITGALNSDTRYNFILTPLRNFLRWANVFGGCLQSNTWSIYKFVSGEGNYSMSSDYNCSTGNECQAILCDDLAENDDISLALYNDTFGYLHLPLLYEFTVPMSWDDYKTIRDNRKNAIGISQTNTDHKAFFIKELTYEIMKGQATIKAWPKEYFEIEVIQGDYTSPGCPVEITVSPIDNPDFDYDEDYQAILDYVEANAGTVPSDAQKLIDNQKVIDAKAEGIWDLLDFLYVPEAELETRDRLMARTNWKSPGQFTLTEVGTLSFDGDGFAGNGTNSYLNTGWKPNPNGVNFTLNEGGFFIKVASDLPSSASKTVFGGRGNAGNSQHGQNNLNMSISGSPTQRTYGVNCVGCGDTTSSNQSGLWHTQRLSSSSVKMFRNSIEIDADTTSVTPDTLSTQPIYIDAFNVNGTASLFAAYRVGVFGGGASLSGKESVLYEIFG